MDLNIKIIEGVQQFPILHDNCGDLDERKHAWRQLAERLDMHVQSLQIGWHALLQLYQRDANFKYAKRMQFIHRNEDSEVKEYNWPEFVITEEYLKDCHNEQQEEFIYLEKEEENNSENLKSSKENANNYAVETQNPDLKSRGNSGSTANKVMVNVNRKGEQSQPQRGDIIIVAKPKSSEADISSTSSLKVKEQLPTSNLNKNNNSNKERCEDVIFGELVSAMLKRMDEPKKKSIKKEIMNILFS